MKLTKATVKSKFEKNLSVLPIYTLPDNVFETTLNRLRWIFDEFDEICVSISGGKDSTVILELALLVAKERDRLPLKVMWLDQECEYISTVEYVRYVADRPEVEMYWYQVPFKLVNATSHAERWLNVWGIGEDWVREKEPDSIHENLLGTTRFTETLSAMGDAIVGGGEKKGALLSGIRSEESPTRRLGMTNRSAYKWATWGSGAPAKHVILHPLYDWKFRDIWKAILDNNWRYNTSYDSQFRYGISPAKMRVSNYHHETAISSLYWLQEVEPDTWEKATQRLSGISTAGHMGKEDFFQRKLPYMFRDWTEYRDYLLEKLPGSDKDREVFRRQFATLDKALAHIEQDVISKAEVQSLIANDLDGTKLHNFSVANDISTRNKKRFGMIPADDSPKPTVKSGVYAETDKKEVEQ